MCVKGIPTMTSFETVSVVDRYGIIFSALRSGRAPDFGGCSGDQPPPAL